MKTKEEEEEGEKEEERKNSQWENIRNKKYCSLEAPFINREHASSL